MDNGYVSLTLGLVHEIAGDILPPLKPLVSIVRKIYETARNAKDARRQASELALFCVQVMDVIIEHCKRTEGHDADVELLLQNKLQSLSLAFQNVLARVKELEHIGTVSFLTHGHSIRNKLVADRVAIEDCLRLFNLDAQINLTLITQKLQIAFEEDLRNVADIVASVKRMLAEFKAEMEDRHVFEAGRTQIQEITRVLEREQDSLGGQDRNSEEYRIALMHLRTMQDTLSIDLPNTEITGEVERTEWEPGHMTGSPQVWYGFWLGDKGRRVAIKWVKDAHSDRKHVSRINRHITVIKRVRHKHINKMYGWCFPPEGIEGICLVHPWMKNGDVLKYIHSNPRADRIKLVLGVALALEYIHTRVPPLVHGAVRPSNILISENGEALLSDFAVAKELLDDSAQVAVSQRPEDSNLRFMSPEAATSDTVGTASDVYSWAMTALQITTDERPFMRSKLPAQVLAEVERGGRPLREDHDPDHVLAIWKLFEHCWAPVMGDRPTATQICTQIANIYPDLHMG